MQYIQVGTPNCRQVHYRRKIGKLWGIEPRPFMEVLKLPLSWVTPDASDASFAGQEPGSRPTHVEHSIL